MADYASAAEVFAALDSMEAEVAARLGALAGLGSAASFVASAAEARGRHRQERAALKKRLGVTGGVRPAAATAPGADLRGLREAQLALVHAHAEGLPALADAHAVDVLARHMVVLAGQLTVIDLWLEAEEGRG